MILTFTDEFTHFKCLCCGNPNTAAGFDKQWNGNWRGPDKWNCLSAYRTRSPRRIAGSKMNRPKHNWTKKRSGK